ncbi:hypothetical protein PCCS19_43940 [Paenibacillus sp. CCS19]|uniref:glycosyltransferase family 2 protein n=1 Tax=Paenibacillus sp. CCS19 TaxID=3158387 RepID=UPI00256A7769|nr:glycosyltransferase family 2 protein [Paenibacillus cellulosilyticus]GMK41338.1 hypothetical protein PCCS19_43940 [Paenibacillus cellulosilyticus]
MPTIISHFYNEQYLLPWWLKHHTQIFEHGILINRGSTDKSVAICKKFAPHWEVRNSTCPEFDALEVDREVMRIESEVPGWKMALNTTEFLCIPSRDHFFHSLNVLGHHMYNIRSIFLIDDPKFGYRDPIYNIPLVRQRHHGIFPGVDQPVYTSGRFIHRFENGQYMAGRHLTYHPSVPHPGPALILKFMFSPWNDAMRRRKLQIGPTLSANSIQQSMGVHHLLSAAQLEGAYKHYAASTEDLRYHPEYQRVFGEMQP